MAAAARVDVLGVGVDPLTPPGAVETIAGWIARGEPNYVCVTGVHGVIESQTDPELRRIHAAAGMVTPDGMPLVWISRRRGAHHTQRVYGPDLMLAVFERSQAAGWRHYLYGGAPHTLDRLQDRLGTRFPDARIVGAESPPFRAPTPEEAEATAARIAESGADIVWVGLSTPKQERWMAANVGRVGAPVLVGVGAAFDFHAGLKRQAPGWVQRSGLEWAFRMATEPRRLARRYLRNNPRFALLLLAETLSVPLNSTAAR